MTGMTKYLKTFNIVKYDVVVVIKFSTKPSLYINSIPLNFFVLPDKQFMQNKSSLYIVSK